MNVRRFNSPRAFFALVEPFLLAHEAENCFFIGHIPTLSEPTDVLLCAAIDDEHDGAVRAVGLMTPGRHLVITRAPHEAAVALAAYLHEHCIAPPGVQAPREAAKAFAAEWGRRTGRVAHVDVEMAVHQLTRVIPPARPAAGAMRAATPADLDRITRWIVEFGQEIGEAHFGEDARAIAERRVGERSILVWEDATCEPVAMAGVTGATPGGIRVNLVYTPPPSRKRGYASTLVATLSQAELDAGRSFCFLYTDLANPTSNKVYRDIGYKPVAENVRFSFG
jgi:predicted GNAT family acetyltransferase